MDYIFCVIFYREEARDMFYHAYNAYMVNNIWYIVFLVYMINNFGWQCNISHAYIYKLEITQVCIWDKRIL